MLQYCFLILTTFVGDTSCKEKYIDLITNDFKPESYFLVLNVKDITGQEERVIIQNHNLYLYLREKQNIKKDDYMRNIKKVLKTGEVLHLKDTLHWGKFIKFLRNEKVEENANKGRQCFFDTYFYDDGELKTEVESGINTIIGKLFEWGIPVKIDHESGSILAVKTFKCK